jgi:hypothetical protein
VFSKSNNRTVVKVTDNQTTEKRRWKPRISHVLLVLLVLGIAWYASFRIRLKSQLRTRFETIRAAGHPVTCAELNDWYTIPENAENAAYIIMDAASFFQEWSRKQAELLPIVGRGELPGRTEPLAEETKSLIAACLADNRQAIQLLHKASAVEHWVSRRRRRFGCAALSSCRRRACRNAR